jgi:hypothetical protein
MQCDLPNRNMSMHLVGSWEGYLAADGTATAARERADFHVVGAKLEQVSE